MPLQILLPLHTYPDGNSPALAGHATSVAAYLEGELEANLLLDVPALLSDGAGPVPAEGRRPAPGTDGSGQDRWDPSATALMIAVGGLLGAGTVDPLPVVACAAVGATLGDWISYSIGRRIGPSVYRRWPLNRHRSTVARARLFFRRYGFVSIFLGRFLGPVRATIPLVAGVMKMDRRRFQLANASRRFSGFR